MTDAVIESMQRAVEDWRDEVSRRMRVSTADPVAHGMKYCADDLLERIRRAEKATERLTPEQYAALAHVGVTAQTVRSWCRAGQLPGAVHTERGWLVPREAKRQRAAG